VYELALRALDEQERLVNDTRARIPPVLAAGGLVVTLLARPVFHEGHPSGGAEIGAVLVGMTGAAALVLASIGLLRPTRMAFSVDAARLLDVAREAGIIDDDGRAHDDAEFHEATALALSQRRAGNAAIVERLTRMLDVALLALVVELVGLASAAALAS
jgi:transposase